MKPDKILYVDDESMALKYFERLVSPMAPVLTAISVEDGQQILNQRGGEIAVLVSDQRMPGANGNELLRYAREHHPLIVRMLTTAYSELGEAIEAINAGEIYRYITKPWDIDSLRADLKNALELADLRNERDGLLREKMLLLQHQLLGGRVGQLSLVCANIVGTNCDASLSVYLDGAVRLGCRAPAVNWHAMDHADLMQAEAMRGIAMGKALAQWHSEFGADKSSDAAAAALVRVLPNHAHYAGAGVIEIFQPKELYGWLEGPVSQPPSAEVTAWLAWLTWFDGSLQLGFEDGNWWVKLDGSSLATLSKDWLAAYIERLVQQ